MPSPALSLQPRVLVYYSQLIPHGGANGVAVWMLEALRKDYQVTLLTWKAIDLAALNRHFGTSLKSTDFRVRTVSPVMRKAIELDPDLGSIQKHAYLMRVSKRLRAEYDLVLSADNEADFGPPALQYLHLPALANVYSRVRSSCDLPLARKLTAIAKGQIRPWMLLADFSFDRMKQNRTLVNSDWTGRWVKQVYGIDSVTVYPPAAGEFSDIPWEEREDGFVMLGRLTPSKRPEWLIPVFKAVRAKYPQIRMHIIGTRSPDPRDAVYFESLSAVVRENSSFAVLHEDLSREDLVRFVARQRYGIHAIEDEHFGMAVSEMVCAGCIPFVHNSGGPPEIVGRDERLIYADQDEAARKVAYVLGNPAEQDNIRRRLAATKDSYSSEAFVRAIRREVATSLARPG